MPPPAESLAATSADSAPASPDRQYLVIARRYRPQTFDELIGQEHVAQALGNAIQTDRVGHAYLFTGARGVGKTSAARILAKALNCRTGPSPTPCNRCDICETVGAGDDVDVLEIDGASNRGIDEIRELRQNVSIRPSRARFRIYIIDEVHMLTREAFNALLKTLEEPPAHVKFIFCTTEPGKIPVTILSRCQRFDFAGIQTPSIVRRLAQIVESEGVEADAAALELLARRAAGSMRDSQSLLEQLLAFSSGRITVEQVHGMLGTAGDERLSALVDALAARRAADALGQLDRALGEGVDAAQLIEQLLGYFRDLMAAAAGCGRESLLYAAPGSADRIIEAGKRLGLITILAAMQILDHALGRMRLSTQARLLAELALVRICQLEELDELPAWIARLDEGPTSGGVSPGPPAPARATPSPGRTASPGSPTAGASRPAPRAEAAAAPVAGNRPSAATIGAAGPIDGADNAAAVWTAAASRVGGMAAEQARQFRHAAFEADNRLVIGFQGGYALAKAFCERPDQASRFEQAASEAAGRRLVLEFRLAEEQSAGAASVAPARPLAPQQRLREVAKHPLVERAGELFGAVPTRVENAAQRPSSGPAAR